MPNRLETCRIGFEFLGHKKCLALVHGIDCAFGDDLLAVL